MTDTDEHENPRGMVQSTLDLFLDSTKALTRLATQAGSVGAHAVIPDPVLSSVNQMLSSLRSFAEQAPQISDELDVLISELHAKRLTIQAVTAELTVLDHQLEILERTLTPVQAWSSQWSELQGSLLHSLDHSADRTESAPPTT